MNKVILMGRLTKDPEMSYSSGNTPISITRFTIAVNRRFAKGKDIKADFINCVAFGKNGEFVKKYFSKGQMISVVGRLQVNQYTDKKGDKRWNSDVIIEENYFTGGKAKSETDAGGFEPVGDINEEDLPF